jgi:ATP-binding cassette, subfamily B, heavy metal transporter
MHGHRHNSDQAPQTKGNLNTPPLGLAQTLRKLWPYVWQYKVRVILAFACMLLGKLANVSVPLSMKYLVDGLSTQNISPTTLAALSPLALLLMYGALRLSTTLFNELREILFAKVTQRTVRIISLQVFEHLHKLSLRFHLNRQTGGVTRDIERGGRGVSSLISYSLYNILPTLIEVTLVLGILWFKYEWRFAMITVIALALYITYTILITNWRTQYRRKMNEMDSAANVKAIDSLLNYETVKYFNNEKFEAGRYDTQLEKWEEASLKSQTSLTLLNLGQSLIIATAVTCIMGLALHGVRAGHMTVGDVVFVNGLMIQLYIPLNFLGVIYREIRQALTDMERLFGLLNENQEVQDKPDAQAFTSPTISLHFKDVVFAYEPNLPAIGPLNFSVPAGQTLAVVGASGAGKSSLARLIYRFYDVRSGAILFNDTDIRNIKQQDLRAHIGTVPQDTVLFNDTIGYNIRYGRPDATQEEIEAAAKAAALHKFIISLPDGYNTQVGERGLKLSGGEKQRVAIARALLKNPALLIFDEATSALDSHSEKSIQEAIESLATNRSRTMVIIAHRLSTIVHADQIMVMKAGQIVEKGSHAELLALNGEYAKMWQVQQSEA